MSFGARPRVLKLRAALASALLAAGSLAGCGSNATQPSAPEPTAERDDSKLPELVMAEPAGSEEPAEPSVDQPVPPEVAQPADTPEARRAEIEAIDSAPRHQPSALAEPARPSRIKPGIYRCSVGDGYKLRECRVEKDSLGRTLLEIGEGNLVSARGVVWDDGASSHFEGWLTDRRPFGCFSCQDRCYIEPGSCACEPAPLAVAKACVAQPVSIELSGTGNQFQGKLSYSHFYATYEGVGGERQLVPGKNAQSLRVRLIFQRPLGQRRKCGETGSASPPCGNYDPMLDRSGALQGDD